MRHRFKIPGMLRRSSARFMLSHPWLFGLSVLGIALGVALVVSIDLANTSAKQAFELSAETVTGRATHQVRGAVEGVDEDVYRRLRIEGRVRNSAPVIEGHAIVTRAGRTFQILGIDPLAEEPFRTYASQEAGIELGNFMARPGTGLIAESVADELQAGIGDTLNLKIGGRTRTLEIAGLISTDDERSQRVMESFFVVDISTAQELFGMAGRLSRIDLILDDNDSALRNRIESLLPEGAVIERSDARSETIRQMTRAFELNLNALSMLALLVGMFLIYSTMTFSVVQRRPLMGRLRALGVTRREVFSLIFGEALIIGILGTAVGLLLGILLAHGLVSLVTQTITDLYFVLTVQQLNINAWTLLKGVFLGLGATIIATIWPAHEAARAPVSTVLQRSVQETGMQSAIPKLSIAGLILGITGGLLLLIPAQSITLAYLCLLLIIVGFSMLIPLFMTVMSNGFRPAMSAVFGLIGRMATRGVTATLSRISIAIAALVVAVAATVGVGVMIDSFRNTVDNWLQNQLEADVYVQPPSLVIRQADATLDLGLVAMLREADGVSGSHTVRSVEVRTNHGTDRLSVVEEGPASRQGYQLKEGDGSFKNLFNEELAVIVSEVYAFRNNVNLYDSIRIHTDYGEQDFPVKAIYYDYASDIGVITMARQTYNRYFDDEGISGLALYTDENTDVDAFISILRNLVPDDQEVLIRSNRALREASMDVFDRTFTVTTVLRLLALLVAFVGVLSALMALQLERSREMAVLRANGMTPRQLWQYVSLQTGVMGLMAGILAVPLGIIMATILVYVINLRSFGWTLQFQVDPEVLLQAVLLAFIAALLAGLYPSWKMARTNPAEALRNE